MTTVERTLYAAEDTFFDGGEQAFFFNFCQQSVCLAQNFLCSLLDDTILLKFYFITDVSAVIEDILCVFDCQISVLHQRSMNCFGQHTG